jgi:hypothetical protein
MKEDLVRPSLPVDRSAVSPGSRLTWGGSGSFDIDENSGTGSAVSDRNLLPISPTRVSFTKGLPDIDANRSGKSGGPGYPLLRG